MCVCANVYIFLRFFVRHHRNKMEFLYPKRIVKASHTRTRTSVHTDTDTHTHTHILSLCFTSMMIYIYGANKWIRMFHVACILQAH